MEVYRSGHNGPDSKSGIQQCIVGSNPTASAIIKNTTFHDIFVTCRVFSMQKTFDLIRNFIIYHIYSYYLEKGDVVVFFEK